MTELPPEPSTSSLSHKTFIIQSAAPRAPTYIIKFLAREIRIEFSRANQVPGFYPECKKKKEENARPCFRRAGDAEFCSVAFYRRAHGESLLSARRGYKGGYVERKEARGENKARY